MSMNRFHRIVRTGGREAARRRRERRYAQLVEANHAQQQGFITRRITGVPRASPAAWRRANRQMRHEQRWVERYRARLPHSHTPL